MPRLNENGYVLVFTTLMFALLMFFVGFATDGGRAYLLRAELTRTVDAAAVAAASRINLGLPAAQNAACDSARMNGMTCANLTVTQVTVNDALGNPRESVQVTGTATTPTVFVRAGKFFGCGANCDAITARVSAVATAGGTIDLVVNLDNTSPMSQDGKLAAAKSGANALVDALLPSGGSSTAMVGMVPFQGCYNNGGSGCVNQQEYPTGMIVSLTDNTTNLHGGINQLTGPGGSGTNVCNGLKRARLNLFGPAARTNSTRYIILLTNSENDFIAGLSGVDGACTSVQSNAGNVALGVKTNDLATQIKNPTSDADGQVVGQRVKIFVIMYGPNAIGSVPANCGPITGSSPTDGAFTRNLSRCIASSAGDVYFAPNASDITAAFQQIISRLPVLLIN
jgi:Flp pilus assembly protein TadG